MGNFENIVSTAEIIIGYVQYLSLLDSINVDWPESWKVSIEWTRLLNFGFNVKLPGIPVLDWRVHFLLVLVFFPLFGSFIVLLFYKPFIVCLWFLVLLLSLAVLVAGGVVMIIPNTTASTGVSISAKSFLIAGGTGCGVCIIAFLVWFVFLRRIKKREVKDEEDDDEALEETVHSYKELRSPPRSKWAHFTKIMAILILVCMGLVLLQIIPLWEVSKDIYNPLFGLGTILGQLCLAVAAIVFLFWLLTLFNATRKAIDMTKLFITSKFVRIFLLALVLGFIPLVNVLLSALNCISLDCPEGTQFPDKDKRISTDFFSGSVYAPEYNEDICEACTFVNECAIAADLCPSITDLRLVADTRLSCDSILPYFAPIASLMFFAIIVGIPGLFFYLIRMHSNLLKQMPVHVYDAEEKWNTRVATTKNSAKSLYLQFELNWRYFKVLLTMQKIGVVILVIFAAKSVASLTIGTTLIHACFLGLSLWSQPYISKVMDILSNSTMMSLTMSSVLSILLHFHVSVPHGVVLFIIIANATFPILGLVIGFIIMKYQARRVANLHELELKKREKEEQAKANNANNENNDGEAKADTKANPDIHLSDVPLTPRTITAIDRAIDTQTMRAISNFLIIVGIISFLSLLICLIGILHSRSNSQYIYSTDEDSIYIGKEKDATKAEFAHYSNWQEFISNCCCLEGSTTENEGTLELWKCRNGFFKERRREGLVDGSWTDSFYLREFCSTNFTDKVCDLPYFDGKQYVVGLCAGDATYESEYMW